MLLERPGNRVEVSGQCLGEVGKKAGKSLESGFVLTEASCGGDPRLHVVLPAVGIDIGQPEIGPLALQMVRQELNGLHVAVQFAAFAEVPDRAGFRQPAARYLFGMNASDLPPGVHDVPGGVRRVPSFGILGSAFDVVMESLQVACRQAVEVGKQRGRPEGGVMTPRNPCAAPVPGTLALLPQCRERLAGVAQLLQPPAMRFRIGRAKIRG